jgi:outer membrane protein assembly factor BamB
MGISKPAFAWAACAAGCWLAIGVSEAHAQLGFASQFELSGTVQLSEPDSAARSHLARVGAFLADKQWDEAVETLRQVMETHGDRVIALGTGRYVSVREYCHAQIVAMPEPALELYRARVDPLAERWCREAVDAQDARLLQRVVDQFFASSWGDDALLALGDIALEQGAYSDARHAWERISPLLRGPNGRPLWLALRTAKSEEQWRNLEPALKEREGPATWLAYRDTNLNLAAVRARLVLASIWEGSLRRAEIELEALRRLDPDAVGSLGGREVVLVDRLAAELAAASHWPAPSTKSRWLTFAGSARRTQTLPPAVRIAGPAWKSHIKLGEAHSADGTFALGGRRIGEDADGLLSYHPLVVGDLLLVSDQSTVRAFNLHTGQPAWRGLSTDGVIYQPEHESTFDIHSRNQVGVPRFTMTAHGNLLFAKLGNPITSRPPDPPRSISPGYLVCLDLSREGSLLRKIEPDDDSWSFEGAPLCDGENLYVAMRRSDVRPQAYVACFDVQTGQLRWRKYICAAETPARGQVPEVTNNLLTLAEDSLYYNTNLGAIASLRKSDGQIEWVSLYERAKRGDLSRRAAHFYRDLNPCVYHAGIVLVAPSDCEQIMGLDAGTGQVLWTSNLADDVVHLIGATGDQLLASGDRLWWLNIYTGKVVRRFPEGKRDGPRGYGRGVLAGHEVYWPTRDRIYIFDSKTTEPTQEPIALLPHGATGGNLLAIDGYLLVAASDTLFGFSQFPRRRNELQEAITRNPRQALPRFRLGQCEAAMQNWAAAIELFRQTLQLAGPAEEHRGRLLVDLAREQLHESLRAEAKRLMAAGKWSDASQLLEESAAVAGDDASRLATLLQAGDAGVAMGQGVDAVRHYQKVLDDPNLASLLIDQTPDHRVQARQVAAERIRRAIHKLGPQAYAEADDRARRTLNEALKQPGTSGLEQVVAQFPLASTTPEATAQLASRYESKNLTRQASQAWRRLAQLAPDRTAQELGLDSTEPVAAWVQRRLVSLDPPRPAEQPRRLIPLSIRWEDATEGSVFGSDSETAAKGRPLLVDAADGLRSVNLESGQTEWTLPLDSPTIWASDLPGQTLVATDSEIHSRGRLSWRFSRDQVVGDLGSFRQLAVADDILIALLGRTHVVGIDLASGTRKWTFTHPEKLLGARLYVVGDQVVVQLADGNSQQAAGEGRLSGPHATVVLGAKDGRLLRTIRGTSHAWVRAPVSWDERRLLTVTSEGWVEMVDVREGAVVWARRPEGASPTLPSDVLVEGDALLLFYSGRYVNRLDPIDGSLRWSSGVRLGDQLSGRPAQHALAIPSATLPQNAAKSSDGILYWVSDGKLKTLRLVDGQPGWSTPVSSYEGDRRSWRVEQRGPWIFTYPTEFIKGEPLRIVALDAHGELVYRSGPFHAEAGEAQLISREDSFALVAPNRIWGMALDTTPLARQEP